MNVSRRDFNAEDMMNRKWTRRTRLGALSSVILVAAGCSDDGQAAAPGAVVRDSAGITIVENPAPTDRTPVWQLEPDPRLAIGEIEAAPEYQLERVAHAARLADGRILIADAGAKALRFYGPDGVHQRSAGGNGSGPGEFEELGFVFMGPADSIHVWDWNLRRLSVFSAEGEFGRSAQIAPGSEGGFPMPFAVLDDGRLLVRVSRAFRSGGGANGIFRDTVPILLYSADGAPIDTLGLWPGSEVLVRSEDRSVSVTGSAFGRNTAFATDGERVFVGDNDRNEIAVHEGEALRRVIRGEGARRPVTQAEIDAYRSRQLESAESDDWRRFTQRMLERMVYPDAMPFFGDIRVDSQGNLWVSDYHFDPSSSRRWTVYAPDGELRAVVDVPEGLRITQIGDDWLVGIRTDELDVQQVVLFGLEKP